MQLKHMLNTFICYQYYKTFEHIWTILFLYEWCFFYVRTFLSNLWRLCARHAEHAQLGQGEAMGVGEEGSVDGGHQQTRHEVEEEGVSQMFQIQVENGQHQAER